MVARRKKKKLMKVKPRFLVGFTDAEGCFSFSFLMVNRRITSVRFEFCFTQKDTEIFDALKIYINDYLKKISPYQASMFPSFVFSTDSYGISQLKVLNTRVLWEVIKPFFDKYKLLTTKLKDYLLFFTALEVWKGPLPRNEKFLTILYLMYESNTQGGQRHQPINYYLDLLEPYFSSADWIRVCYEAIKFRDATLLVCDKALSDATKTKISSDYVVGLVAGDGCFHADIDMRAARKATIRKGISISLSKTNHNEAILDNIASLWGSNWTKRPSMKNRCYVKIDRMVDIQNVIQPFFKANLAIMPNFKSTHFSGWGKIDELLPLLKACRAGNLAFKKANSLRIRYLIKEIYNIHDGTYRNYSLVDVLNRFSADYGIL